MGVWIYKNDKQKYIYVYMHITLACIDYGCDVEIGHSGNYQNYMTHIYDTDKFARNLEMWGTFILNSFHAPSKRQGIR